ncbi:LuxR C-terminal-related transcriptional regulator [Streptosporangium sp. NPDC049376]|uniref:helix-turn-helix transcriptional regulator n=1 Tax=Streptosporangium sp. NPDC049376 TaxID=3366192 RepID=UPI0037B72F8B
MNMVRGPGNLPVDLSSFVGRAEELAEGLRHLTEARIMTVTGPAGVGKTRTALRLAARLRRRFPGGTWRAELSGTADPVTTLAEALELPRTSSAREIGAALRERRPLVVLDTCEHIPGEVAALTEDLLAEAPRAAIVVTGRRPLGLPGERVLQLAPLPLTSAVRLFEDRAMAVDPRFALTPATAPIVAEICGRLDGLPLAIELAATLVRSMLARDLLEELRHRFTLLTGVSRTVLPRHRDLRAAVMWSYDLCDAEQRELWALLSALPGSFGLADARAACRGHLPGERVASVLAKLVEGSVVLREPGERYRMLEAYRRVGLEPSGSPWRPAVQRPLRGGGRLPSPRQPGGTARPAGTLSARELQVAKLITEGLSNPEIAVRLDIAKRTVDAHVRNILAKGGLASRTQVAAWVAESDYQSST